LTLFLLDELENLHRGQGLDLGWRANSHVPSVEDYITMIDNKTGGLLRLIVRLMEAESTVPTKPDLLKLATLFGRYYQIRDDYYNLTSEEVTALALYI
jgi:geranylgeranyl diphosphate synthase type 3